MNTNIAGHEGVGIICKGKCVSNLEEVPIVDSILVGSGVSPDNLNKRVGIK